MVVTVTYFLVLNTASLCGVCANISILQVSKVRLRDIMQLAQVGTPSKWRNKI